MTPLQFDLLIHELQNIELICCFGFAAVTVWLAVGALMKKL